MKFAAAKMVSAETGFKLLSRSVAQGGVLRMRYLLRLSHRLIL